MILGGGSHDFPPAVRQTSGTYSYLLASRPGGEALIIDPVLEKVDRYLQLVNDLDLKLVKAVDTHIHADHITGLGALRDRTHCITVMGENAKVDVVSMRVTEGDKLTIEGVSHGRALHARTHGRFLQLPDAGSRVHRRHAADPRHRAAPTSRTAARAPSTSSLFNKLLKLPEDTLVYPAHDYKGDTVSTIGEEKRHNPRLQVKSVDEYVDVMGKLNLPNPKMMDVAVPANMRVGLAQDEIARKGWAVTPEQAVELLGKPDVALVDLREDSERDKHGMIPGSLHVPYTTLQANIGKGGILYELAHTRATRIVLYCAFGERSAMAVRAAQDAGITSVCHVHGGLEAWRHASGPLVRR